MALIDMHMLMPSARGMLAADRTPVGAVIAYMGSAVPDHWLLCDGRAVSRTAYPVLFARLGTVYGEGDGTSTFNLPDLRGRFLEGADNAGVVKEAGLPNIDGTVAATESGWAVLLGCTKADELTGAFRATNINGEIPSDNNSFRNDRVKSFDFDASRSSPIYGNSTTVQPAAITTMYIIKAVDNGDGGGMINARDEIHESCEYVAPVTGWYTIVLKGGGGGGSGGGKSSSGFFGGMGGMEGNTTIAYEFLHINDSVSITIGAGGAGGQPDTSSLGYQGEQGGTTSITVNDTLYTAAGGIGGRGNAVSFDDTVIGACGSWGVFVPISLGVGGGGGPGGGNGGGYYTTATQGGGGHGGSGTTTPLVGGDGGDGYVWFLYHDPRKQTTAGEQT